MTTESGLNFGTNPLVELLGAPDGHTVLAVWDSAGQFLHVGCKFPPSARGPQRPIEWVELPAGMVRGGASWLVNTAPAFARSAQVEQLRDAGDTIRRNNKDRAERAAEERIAADMEAALGAAEAGMEHPDADLMAAIDNVPYVKPKGGAGGGAAKPYHASLNVASAVVTAPTKPAPKKTSSKANAGIGGGAAMKKAKSRPNRG